MDLFEFLEQNGIRYERFDHPPVFTIEDVNRLIPDLPGAETKNLFFKDHNGKRHILVSMPADKPVDLKALPGVIGARRVSFASHKRLITHLGITPGAVSLLAIFNDRENQNVELYVDEELWAADAFQFHPLVNTSTLVIAREGIVRFVAATGHQCNVVKVPSPNP